MLFFLYDFLGPNCVNTHKPKFVNLFGIDFGIEKYAWRLDIVQNPCEYFLCDFMGPDCDNTPNYYAYFKFWKKHSFGQNGNTVLF